MYNNNKGGYGKGGGGGGYNNQQQGGGGGNWNQKGGSGMNPGGQQMNTMNMQGQNMGGGDGLEGPGAVTKQEPDWTIKEGVSEFEQENDFCQFFKYIQGYHSCTHSSMIGPSDHRIPRSGKFDVTRPEAVEKLHAAVAFFYKQGKPLVLCEIATSRFRFFEDVDLLLPASLKGQEAALQDKWVNGLLQHRGAVLGAIWRSSDPLVVKPIGDSATVHVFSSSGWSSRHNQPKISLHFVWPDLIVTPREAKGIRSATIEYLRESWGGREGGSALFFPSAREISHRCFEGRRKDF